MKDQNFKNLSPTKVDLHKILKIHDFFVFVLQRENVHNLNRRKARSALKARSLGVHLFVRTAKPFFCAV